STRLQSPSPPFQARELKSVKNKIVGIKRFQSPPAFSGEGTALRQANDNRKVIRVVARTRLQLNSYAVNTPFPIK
ncbi:hypothetical protein, partial [Thiolapillus sp.]|uniref:hypothetical protein n=1 Tax=Thiolapillus sp. TaxID=2017437 RepID=UPI003AF95CA5